MGGGDLHVKPNKFLEQWAARREAVEHGWRFTPKNVMVAITVGLVVPAAVYAGICGEFVRTKYTHTHTHTHIQRERERERERNDVHTHTYTHTHTQRETEREREKKTREREDAECCELSERERERERERESAVWCCMRTCVPAAGAGSSLSIKCCIQR